MQGLNTNTNSFKQAFLKNLLLGLQAARTGTTTTCTSFHAMSLLERKRAVKSSADVAMAAARDGAGGGGARWPKAILAAAAAAPSSSDMCKARRCRRIVRRYSYNRHRGSWRRVAAAGSRSNSTSGPGGGSVARRLVRRRTMALREVIPGGRDAVDEASLLREAMDYVVHLRAQVDVLRRVSEAVQINDIQLPY